MLNIPVPLSQIPVGATGMVSKINSEGIIRRRLLDLGFVSGTKIEVLRKSPIGDPTAYFIRGAIIALREVDAEKILVSPLKDNLW
ncbi:MAG: iron transporter FeoA [Desulfitibacter sp. BRH_c19]|nr:MAG: iron transporter FeoA [Desulfitibacter sp. BRH_c19]